MANGISGGFGRIEISEGRSPGPAPFGEEEHDLEEINEKKSSSAAGKQVLEKRSWPWSVAASVAVVGVGIAISATVNPLFDRAVHWDWMAVLAPVLLIGLAVALRNRWA
ncbi:MAG: hypothetical protein OTJ97_06550 [SAR202 cluster bacterium]|nr:hypothetical protein [SAR202 cluster bacterium]